MQPKSNRLNLFFVALPPLLWSSGIFLVVIYGRALVRLLTDASLSWLISPLLSLTVSGILVLTYIRHRKAPPLTSNESQVSSGEQQGQSRSICRSVLQLRGVLHVSGAQLCVLLGSSIYVFLIISLQRQPEEILHLIQYGILSLLIFRAITLLPLDGAIPLTLVAVTAWSLASVHGVFDELLQWLLPSRSFDWRDIILNSVASSLSIATLHGASIIAELPLILRKGYPRSVARAARVSLFTLSGALFLTMFLSPSLLVFREGLHASLGYSILPENECPVEYGADLSITSPTSKPSAQQVARTKSTLHFRSRLTLEEHQRWDSHTTQEQFSLLHDCIIPERYPSTLRQLPPHSMPHLHESCVRLFRIAEYRRYAEAKRESAAIPTGHWSLSFTTEELLSIARHEQTILSAMAPLLHQRISAELESLSHDELSAHSERSNDTLAHRDPLASKESFVYQSPISQSLMTPSKMITYLLLFSLPALLGQGLYRYGSKESRQ